MAVPTFVAASTLVALESGNSVPVTAPAGKAAGDFLILVFFCNTNHTLVVPVTGWTQFGGANNNSNFTFMWMWRRADGTATDTPTLTTTGTAASTLSGHYARMYAFRGVDPAGNGFDATSVWAGPTSSTTPASAAIVTAGPDRLVVRLAVVDDDNTWSSGMPPAGYTNIGGRLATTLGADAMSDGIAIARPTAGSTAAVNIGTMNAADYWGSAGFALIGAAPVAVGKQIQMVWNVVESPPPPSVSMVAYRFFDAAGTEASAAPLSSESIELVTYLRGDGFVQIRILLQSANATDVPGNSVFQLVWEKNGDGYWYDVATVGTTAIAYDSPTLTDGAPTTQRLTGGTGTFTPGKVSEDGNVSLGWVGNNYTEILFSVRLVDADLASGDVLRFLLYRNGGGLDYYFVVPMINIFKVPVASRSLNAVWSTRSAVGDTATLRWHNRLPLGDTLNPRWAVRTRIGDQADLRWHARARIADQSDLRWHVRALVGDAINPRWSVRSIVSDIATLRWNVEVAPTITQSDYQFFAEAGTESGAAPLAPQNTPITGNLINVVGYGQIRIRLQSTTAVPVEPTEDFRLQYEKNGTGTWIDLASSVDTAFPHDAPSLIDGEPTTQRLTGGTGTFTPGKVSKTGTVTDVGWEGNGHTELLYSAKLIGADLVEGDTIRFRVANPYISEATARAPVEMPEVLLVSEVGGYRLYTKIAGVLTLVGLYTKVAGVLTQVPVVRPSVATVSLFGTRVPNTPDSTAQLVLGHLFSASVSGSVTALRYYKMPGMPAGTRVGGLFRGSDGAPLIEANFTGETASGWQTQAITPMPVTAGANYGVSIYYPTGNVQYEDNVFNSGYVNGVLSAPAGAGRWGVGATGPGMPTGTGNSWYGCDVEFQPGLYPTNNLFGSTLPTALDTSTNQVEVGMRFRSSVAGTITGVRFYKSDSTTGTHTGSIYDNAGTLLTRGDFVGETPAGWQQQTFGTPVSIAANTTYVVGVFFSAGRYEYILNQFNSTFTNGPLSAPAGGTTSTDFNGCYIYGGSPAFPINGNGATDAWFGIDIVFQPT